MKTLLLPLAISAVIISYGWSDDKSSRHAVQDILHPPQGTGAYEKKNIDEIMSDSDDEELVKLSGEIIKKLKCSTYLFRDESGEIRIHIADEDIPKKGLLFNSPVTIRGEVEKVEDRPVRVEADKLRYMF